HPTASTLSLHDALPIYNAMTTTTTTLARGKYHIWTVGCQMNQADSQRIQTILEELGWEETSMDQANLVILNTCSVRKAPEEKAQDRKSTRLNSSHLGIS